MIILRPTHKADNDQFKKNATLYNEIDVLGCKLSKLRWVWANLAAR